MINNKTSHQVNLTQAPLNLSITDKTNTSTPRTRGDNNNRRLMNSHKRVAGPCHRELPAQDMSMLDVIRDKIGM